LLPSDGYAYCFAPYAYPDTDTLPFWPAMEGYADAFWPPDMSEFRVNKTVAHSAYAWDIWQP